ncbi:hypothetical protein [Plantactinospora sp. KBS50]|uniref:hypothetical protein n=1 Tax=Plantactinospora sp. KBS50 TaxID=2024580 RepID=UPI000BAAFDEC|nr:hypothetical protein [Plantactinospora sp. KBS50]ASW56399.1 hypothetical protein CIK06_22920 [Plantactinospora sp. KBS50]
MRHHDQINDEHPDVVKSDPVPVPPPARDGMDDPNDLDDRDTDLADRDTDLDAEAAERPEHGPEHGDSFDDPVLAEPVDGPDAGTERLDDGDADGHDPDGADASLDDRLDEARNNDLIDDEPAPGDRTAETAVDAPLYGEPADERDADGFAEPAPQPTAFGAGSPGGAVAASAMAGDGRPTEHDVDETDLDRTEDGALDDDVDADATVAEAGDNADADALDNDAVDNEALDDDAVDVEPVAAAEDDPDARTMPDETAAGTDSPEDGTDSPEEAADVLAPADIVESDTDTVAHPDTVESDTVVPTDTVDTGTVDTGTASPTGDGALPPGAVPTEPVTALIGDRAGDFRDRWRDVQLRFVDDPQAAVGEAQGLVDEAIEALAAALSRQKDELGTWRQDGTNDTEQLRVLVRRYRDFLDRVLGL